MDRIGRVGGVGAPAVPGRTRAAAGSFRVPAGDAAVTQAAAAAAPAALDGLLSLQEQEGDWLRDRPARRHAESLLDELAALQRELLHGGDLDPALLQRLASLSRAAPAAFDPRLAAVLRAASLRVAVELARRTAT